LLHSFLFDRKGCFGDYFRCIAAKWVAEIACTPLGRVNCHHVNGPAISALP